MSAKSKAAQKAPKELNISTKSNEKGILGPLLFAHASSEDVAAYQPDELLKAAELAGAALLQHKPGKSVLSIDQKAVTRNKQPITVLTLVNDNKPFLLDSVMNVINELSSRIYLVAHPVVDIAADGKNALSLKAETTAQEPAKTMRRVSLMQIHIQNLGKTQVKKLQEDISLVLEQVSAAVRDWKPMLSEVQKLMKSYQKDLPKKRARDGEKVVEFLTWLMDNNFTFLGMRAYDFRKGKTPTEAFKARGVELGVLADSSIRILGDSRVEEAPREVLSFMESDELLIVTKANSRSMVHRPVWLDYVGVKLFDKDGKLSGELRIVGQFTSTAYTSSVLRIPFLKEKSRTVIERLGYNATDHSGKALINVLESYPRDEMFRADVETLTQNAGLILELGERPRLRVLAHADPFGRFVSVLVFVPRDRYDTDIREKIGAYLLKAYGGDFFEFHPMFMEGALTRVYYVVHRKGSDAAPVLERLSLEENVAAITRNWDDSIELAAAQAHSPVEQIALAKDFPDSYRDSFQAQAAIDDAGHILALDQNQPLNVVFYHHETDGEHAASLKLFHRGDALALSERVPLLENMGFRVIAEQTLELKDLEGNEVYLHDMQLENAYGKAVDLSDHGALLAEAFEAIWAEDADDDAFNALTQTARLNWREIIILRQYGRYLQQAGIPYSQERLAKALNSYPAIARDLYALFRLKFDPAQKSKDNERNEKAIQDRIETELQTVPSLDDDLIIRRYRNLIAASLRTNAFTPQKDGSARRILATKLNPREVEGLPEPRPYREIFVYGPEVEGVHLRFGPVARGGIRWSDRALDYRTEVLGLVKAQQVKNAVIVPVGSKGGFYPHRLPQSNDRAVVGEAARQAYIQYISAMLSITDNLINGKVVPPKGVIRHDGDDPYFVVAADKGTATFSDTANAISQSYDFWLDDAFASGGSAGYDHKEMGITAKGAWEAVKRHFRELFSRDIQTTPFTCVGVGDMSGDVFGNGMLLSKQTKLIAAFDHRDIFIDPDPDMAKGFAERQRLFNLPRSSWQDYDASKISKGGGVFSRSLKTITLSAEAAKAIGFDKKTGTPFEIINAILKADVDLLWFGGIGTYIRSSAETNAQVGDRANDVIRITGKDVRAKVIGEGANLGMTQRGRIEYAMKGGRCDTDAIDNSAGVNCSDIEVNIKIALASAMRAERLTRKARDKLLKEMTPQVSELVLRNNYLQPLTLSLAESRSTIDLPYQMRFMNDLERRKLLDRRVEILPDDQALRERLAQGHGLTRPELSVVMAYAKLTLQEEVTNSALSNDSYFQNTLFGYFPTQMQKKYAADIESHQLRRDIIATILANDIVNRGGPTFVNRLQDKTGQSVENVVRAYIAVRDGFDIPALYEELDKLDNKISGQTQNRFYAAVTHMLFATTGWILRNIDLTAPLDELVKTITNARLVIEKQLDQLMPEYMRHRLGEVADKYVQEGAPKTLARQLALLDVATIIPDIALVARQAKADLVKTAQLYFTLAEMFRINRIEEASHTIPVVDYYDGMALAQANDTIAESLRGIVMMVLKTYGKTNDPAAAWVAAEGARIEDMTNRMSALIEGDLNISRFTFAAGMMANLAAKP
ncbi:NAD-glutamate dehydrogenase [Bartonella sp. LJL80]